MTRDIIRLIFAADPGMRTCGTTKNVRVLPISPRLLLEARTHFRQGHLVRTMIDRADPERRNQNFPGPNGTLRISSALVRVAIRCDARIIFIAARLPGGSEIVITLDEPCSSTTADDVLRSFVGFLERATKMNPHYFASTPLFDDHGAIHLTWQAGFPRLGAQMRVGAAH